MSSPSLQLPPSHIQPSHDPLRHPEKCAWPASWHQYPRFTGKNTNAAPSHFPSTSQDLDIRHAPPPAVLSTTVWEILPIRQMWKLRLRKPTGKGSPGALDRPSGGRHWASLSGLSASSPVWPTTCPHLALLSPSLGSSFHPASHFGHSQGFTTPHLPLSTHTRLSHLRAAAPAVPLTIMPFPLSPPSERPLPASCCHLFQQVPSPPWAGSPSFKLS